MASGVRVGRVPRPPGAPRHGTVGGQQWRRGIIAIPYTQWFKAPAAAFAVCAILPLLPGLSLFQGLSTTTHPSGNGISPLVTALSIALALAGGLTFGEYVGIVSWRKLRLVELRFFAPLFAEPFATEHGSGGGEVDEASAD